MDYANGTGRPVMPCEPVTEEKIRTVHERTFRQITNAYGNLGMMKTDLEKLPVTNARNQLIVELGGILNGLEQAHKLAKETS